MNEYSRANLNVKRLLALNILNIREIAEQNESLTADDYFSKVEQFIEDAARFGEIITTISKLEENLSALKALEAKLGIVGHEIDFVSDSEMLTDLENLRTVLSEIGFNELDFDLDAVCLAIKNANLPLAEKLAGDAAVKFDTLYDSIKGTYSVKKFASTQEPDAPANPLLLSAALELLDSEEASRKLRILAVDDVTIVLNMLTSLLSPHYEVYALKNSSQLENFLKHTTPELFLLDIEMNEINGFDLVPIIRQFDEHKDTPIIFLTGNASMDNLKGAIALGACDFITKPVKKEILLDKIEKNIVRKRAY